jgi:tetratricopeptide (TPR) repeat protein
MNTLLALPALVAIMAFSQAPAGWNETDRQGRQLMLAGKAADAITLFERAVNGMPNFEGAHYALADAHRFLGIELATKGPSQATERRRHLELAATQYRWVAERGTQYRQLAAGQLMNLYGADELNRPREAIPFARLYLELSPSSVMGHAGLARLLRTTGDAKGATAVLLAARGVVASDDRPALATSMVDHVINTPDVPPADVRALLDYAGPVLDAAIALEPDNRRLVLTKAAVPKLRAERVERDPAIQKALQAESDRIFDRFQALNPDRGKAVETARTPDPPADPEPPGYKAARDAADALYQRKEYPQAAAIYEKFVKSHPAFPPPHYLRLGALLAAGQRDVVDAALKAARTAVPATADSRYMMATYLVELEMKTPALSAADARKLLNEAVLVLDDALALKPGFADAVVYKAVARTRQARLEPDPAAAKALSAEADKLRAQAQALRKP